MNGENVSEIKSWLRDALVVFDKVAEAEQRLGSLLNENARAGIRAQELQADTERLEKEKAALERMIEALKDGGKTPRSPLTETEWTALLRDATAGFGGVREYIEKLADFFGAK